jgi:hypothetical protein
VDHPRAGPAGRSAGVLEERQVAAGRAVLVGVEQVIDGRVVLVDGLLDHPQAQDSDVELDVAGRVAGDRRDVVDALELHRVLLCCARNILSVVARATSSRYHVVA